MCIQKIFLLDDIVNFVLNSVWYNNLHGQKLQQQQKSYIYYTFNQSYIIYRVNQINFHENNLFEQKYFTYSCYLQIFSPINCHYLVRMHIIQKVLKIKIILEFFRVVTIVVAFFIT